MFNHSYGEDLQSAPSLTGLLRQIIKIPGEFRVRLGSLDPVHITDELVDLIENQEKICPHIHLSMQSGSSMILKRMKRRYVRSELFEKAQKLRAVVPDLVLSADVMAGFPTESEDHFAESLSALQQLEICFPHVFPYSERQGTPAARIPKQVPKPERARRAEQLRALGKQNTDTVLQRHVGRAAKVLIERAVQDGSHAMGRTDNYLPVSITGSGLQSGQFVQVNLVDVENQCLSGISKPQ